VPALLAAAVIATLVVGGVLSLSSVLYAGLFGGMIFMHAGGHGHGGGTADAAERRRQSSSHSQPAQSGSDATLEARAADDPMTRENSDHDQHGSHGCH
jgi:hypothetical protein